MAIELEDLDSAIVKDSVTGKSMIGAAILAGSVTLTAGDISVSDVTIAGGTVNVEPGVAPLVAEIEPGSAPIHAIVDSGAVNATIPSRETDLPLGLVKVEAGAITADIPSRDTDLPLGLVKVEAGNIVVDSVTAQIHALLNSQVSSSGDGVLTTDYAQDYMVRGKAFQIQRRISFAANQTICWVVDFTPAENKTIFALPVICHSGGGLVLLDTYLADSYTGGTTVTPLNVNSLSANTALSVVKSGINPPAVSSGLREYVIGTAKTNQAAGGGLGGAEVPKILPRSPRVFKFMNQEASAVTIDFGFVWYELDAV